MKKTIDDMKAKINRELARLREEENSIRSKLNKIEER